MSRVIVIGSINQDVVLQVEDFPKIGESISGKTINYYAGGKGLNQAIAAAKAESETLLIGKIGNDNIGQKLNKYLEKNGVNTNLITISSESNTGLANIVVNKFAKNMIIGIGGANSELKLQDFFQTINLNENDVILAQFEVPLETIYQFFVLAKKIGCKLIVNPSPAKTKGIKILEISDIIIINEVELMFFADISELNLNNHQLVCKIANKIKKKSDQIIILTMGKKGVLVIENNDFFYIKNLDNIIPIDTVGAGDCFAGYFSTFIVKGYSIKDATKMANIASNISVTQKGAAVSIPSLAAVKLYMDKNNILL